MADKVIRTQRLEIVDEQGRVRASIGQHLDTFGVELVDQAGRERLSLNLHEDGHPGLFMSNGDNIVVSLCIVDDDGTVRHHLSRES